MPPRRSARAAVAAPAKAPSPSPSPPPAPPVLPLKACRIVVSGAFPGQQMTDVVDKASELGAATSVNVTKTVTHFITSQSEYDNGSAKILKAKDQGVHILSVDWLAECEKENKLVDETPYLLSTTTAAAAASGSTPPAPNGTTKGNGRKRAASPDASDDDTKPAGKRTKKDVAAAAAQAMTAVSSSKLQAKAEKAAVNGTGTFVKKAKGNLNVPVDDACHLANLGYQVYIDAENIIYDANLNQTNASNNNNKFYRVQLLFNPKATDYKTWTRWGRVGEFGQNALLGSGSLDSAIASFNKKFKDKSGLAWANRLDTPKSGKYTFIERNYDDEDSDDEAADTEAKKEDDEDEYIPPKSQLEQPLQDLMALIFNQSYLNASMSALNYDANKLPLGKLSKSTILRGFQALKDLAALFDDNTLAQSVHSMPYGNAVEALSNQFYSIIPHDFGRNRPPVISSETMLKKEIELLESLGDMKEAAAIMKANRPKDTVHQYDRQFATLNMEEVTTLDKTSDEFKLLAQYLVETRGATHNVDYEVEEIFRIERNGEKARFEESEYAKIKKSDRRLLWHGSRTTNFGGILSQGLRIAPPEAPVSGYMFGKGIYLADMSSKSANYCYAYNSGGTALLLLCEAELGDPMQEMMFASYGAAEGAKQRGCYSTWGKGTTGPSKWRDAGCVHPSLKGVKIPDVAKAKPAATKAVGASLLYNEYIVYDIKQVRLRYLFRVKM